MRRILLLVVILFLSSVLSGTVVAQHTPASTIIALHQTADGAVQLYQESVDASTVLLPADVVPADAFVRGEISPTLDYVAVLVEQINDSLYRPGNDNLSAGMPIAELGLNNTLYIIDLDTGEILLERQTFPDDFQLPGEWFPGENPILNTDITISWSPDGSRLVWLEGTPYQATAERNGYGRLSVFDTTDSSVTALPAHDGTPYKFQWSPDGQYGAYQAIDNFGTGAGYNGVGTFVLLPDNSVRDVPLPSERVQDIWPYGWLADNTFVFSMFSIISGGEGLFTYSPTTETVNTLIAIQQQLNANASAIHPASGQILVTVTDFVEQDGPFEPGTYLYSSPTAEPQLIVDEFAFPETASFADFLSEQTIYLTFRSFQFLYRGTYDIVTGELMPDERFQQYVSLADSDNGTYFTHGDPDRTPQLLSPPLEGGDAFDLPGLRVNGLRWLTDDVFVGYRLARPTSRESSLDVMVGTRAGELRLVTVTDGLLLDVRLQ